MPRFEEEIHLERLSWFIRLRWIAVAGGLAILLAGPLVVPLNVDYGRLILCLAALGLLNAGYLWYWERAKTKGLAPESLVAKARGLFHVQMLADLFLLTLMLFFSGGSQNPLTVLFLFHLAISAMVFSESESLFYAALAAGIPWLLFFAGRAYPPTAFFWEGRVQLTRDQEISLLWSYTLAVAGLWFFLSRLALDLKDKERGLREAGERLLSANEELKHLDLFKSRFLKQVVQQLKNPAMDVGLELAAVEKTLPAGSGKGHKAVEGAKQRVWSLLQLIDDLTWLSRARIQDLPFKKQWVDVYETLLGAVQAKESEAEGKGIHFRLHGDPQVRLRADQAAFKRVAENLIANAVQYSPRGAGDILVEFKTEGEWLSVTVEDHGIGIPAAAQKKLFQDFYRGPNAKVDQKFGTGLGLTIVKYILDLHGGRVVIKSEPRLGTKVETFWPHSLTAGEPEALPEPELEEEAKLENVRK